ncbi:MAG TPA: hypothetical protein VLO29_10805 [Salegentibacter sp.]|nr:hypothetical protein [Salegentibacter sp.]
MSNNSLYIKALEKDQIPQQTEELSTADKFNEYVMTRLRTKFGVSLPEVEEKFGTDYTQHFLKNSGPLQQKQLLEERDGVFYITAKGKFLSDGIAADLFYLE